MVRLPVGCLGVFSWAFWESMQNPKDTNPLKSDRACRFCHYLNWKKHIVKPASWAALIRERPASEQVATLRPLLPDFPPFLSLPFKTSSQLIFGHGDKMGVCYSYSLVPSTPEQHAYAAVPALRTKVFRFFG